MRKKNSNEDIIKKKYLRKLSLELIRRGISNNQIKSTLNEVAITLTDYISEKEFSSLEEIEQAFGSVKDFCDNNMLEYSKEASFGQLIHTSIIGISFIAIFALAITSFLFNPYIWMLRGSSVIILGVSIANTGNGFIGTLFGLNMLIWIIYLHIKKKFSKYDIREITKKIILGLYWFISIVCLIQAILPYAIFAQTISDMWKQGMKLLVVEGIVRWLFLGVFLILTATLYTIKYLKNDQKFENKTFMIDNLKIVFIFFILTSFIIPKQGIGILVVLLGLCILLFGKVNGETWFIGTLAISIQAIVLGTKAEYYVHSPVYSHISPIIFGVKFSFNRLLGRGFVISIILLIILAILWTIVCVIILRKRQKRLFPTMKIPNKKKLLQSIMLLSLIGVAALGSQPQYTMIASSYDHFFVPPEPNQEYIIFDLGYKIPAEGTIYLSVFTNVNLTLDEITYQSLEGNWTARWDYGPVEGGMFGDVSEFEYIISSGVIGLDFLEFKARGPGILEIHFELDMSTFGGIFPYFDVRWVPTVPWFPTWLEIMIASISFLLLFFTWEEPTNSKKKTSKIKEPKEET
jgi:hypothetical protein